MNTDKHLPIVTTQRLINHFEATDSRRHACNQPVTGVCTKCPVSHAASEIHTERAETQPVVCSRKCNHTIEVITCTPLPPASMAKRTRVQLVKRNIDSFSYVGLVSLCSTSVNDELYYDCIRIMIALELTETPSTF